MATTLENLYNKSLATVLGNARERGRADLIVGIPFQRDTNDAVSVLEAVQKGLETFFPELKCVIVCPISPFALSVQESMKKYSSKNDNVITFALTKKLWGRGWAMRGLMDLTLTLNGDLLVLEPDLMLEAKRRHETGPTPDWIKLLYQPILHEQATFVLPRLRHSLLGNIIAEHFYYPLIASFYGLDLSGCVRANLAVSRKLIPGFVEDCTLMEEHIAEYAIDASLLFHALQRKEEILEVYLGDKPKVSLPVSLSNIFIQIAKLIFDFIGDTQETWQNRPATLRSPLMLGPRENFLTDVTVPDCRPYIDSFRRGYNRYYEPIYSRIFPEEITVQLQEIVSLSEEDFSFSDVLWSRIVYISLVAYHFYSGLEKEDLIRSLAPLFEGRIAGFICEVSRFENCGSTTQSELPEKKMICTYHARACIEQQVDIFLSRKQLFQEKWLHHREELQPFLPEIAYWEYIPGVPIVLPHIVRSRSGNTAHVVGIYEQLLKEYNEDFRKFIGEEFGLSLGDGSAKIGAALQRMIQQFEWDLDETLLPGDFHSVEGIREIMDEIFNLLPPPESYSLKEEVAAILLKMHPPRNIITLWGYRDTDEMLRENNPLDVLALSSLTEETKYTARNNDWLRENLQPKHMKVSPVKPLIVSYLDFPSLSTIKEAPSLNYLASRVVFSNLRWESGGRFPKIRLLTTVLKSIIDAEQFGKIWESFALRGKEFSRLVTNSIEGHWGMNTFSAHSIFENQQQQILQKRLLAIAEEKGEGPDVISAMARLEKLAKVFHLGITLPDGVFVTCSMWSWASYSFKGGKGIPTPLSLMIERRWFSSELFFRCYEAVGGKREEIFPRIVELIGQGRESEDLSVRLLNVSPECKDVILEQNLEHEQPRAGNLRRSASNPLLSPIADHNWENKYVLNCGAIRVDGGVHIFYRAVGNDRVSRIGLAVSGDGLRIDERMPDPVFAPADNSEKMGCEDPRLIEIDGRIYMLYTAYDGALPQIALASISKDDLLNRRWEHWHRHGLVFPGFTNKDAVLFPERFNGRLAMYHRISPSIWVTYSDTFETPWPREGHNIVFGSRSGAMWDAVKIGAGAQPLKTKHGWLNIYHGVDFRFHYSLGVFLTALDDPARLLYRSPNAILEPEHSYEVGVSGESWVPNVVFTCGAVSAKDKAVLEDDDEIYVYYGGADTVIGMASATVAELIPGKYRQKS